MNSKNFNAAEKHFEKKRIKMQNEIDYLSQRTINAVDKLDTKIKEVQALKEENDELKKKIELLMTNANMTKEDVARLCCASETLHSINAVASMLACKGLY